MPAAANGVIGYYGIVVDTVGGTVGVIHNLINVTSIPRPPPTT